MIFSLALTKPSFFVIGYKYSTCDCAAANRRCWWYFTVYLGPVHLSCGRVQI